MSQLGADVPRALFPLLRPARYKVARGGRGGAKSHFFAELLLLRCYSKPTRAVCIREVQNSIKESVRQLLVDKIAKLGLGDFFETFETEIRAANGSLIIFKGMQSYSADNIKSLEGYDIAWWEEAQTASARSLRLLRPTLRKEGSELWFSYNRRHDTDPVDVMFSGANIPEDAIVVDVGWQDNPWFPDVLRKEMEHDYRVDPDMAEHVWGGDYERVTDAAYYARWIAAAEKEGRVGHFPHRSGLPVHTAWDIGVDDYTAIWFVQEDGHAVTVLDYYETQNDGAEQIVKDALPEYCADVREGALRLIDLGRDPWRYGNHYFPHDVKVREWGAGARSRVETLMGLGLRNIVKGAQLGPEERVNATRLILPITRFNATKRVMVGLSRLRRYSRKLNEQMGQFQGPLKDGNDHGADAFGEYAVNCPLTNIPAPPVKKPWVLQTGVRIGPPKETKGRKRV